MCVCLTVMVCVSGSMFTVSRRYGSFWAVWISAIALRSDRRDPPVFLELFLPTALWVRAFSLDCSKFHFLCLFVYFCASVLSISCALMQLGGVVSLQFLAQTRVSSEGQTYADAHSVYSRRFAHGLPSPWKPHTCMRAPPTRVSLRR